MRLFGHNFSSSISFRATAPLLTLLVASATLTGTSATANAQATPYVIPYTMSTFAGPNANYTVGAACNGSSTLKALDVQGDGCLAPQVSVGVDPHDIRVDAKGNIYWLDNSTGSLTLVHKISAATGLSTVYLGSNLNSTPCTAHSDTYGDGCPSTDGAANANASILTTALKLKNQRGIAVGPNGDLFTAGYNDYNIHKVSAATGTFAYTTTAPATTIVSGTFSLIAGISGATAASTTVTPGSAVSTGIGSSRGVGVDAAGNVYIADTGNNIIQEVTINPTLCGAITPPCQIPLTGANSAGTKIVTSGVSAASALVDAPEDVQIDNFGNIIIADAGNNVVRAIYVAGTLPGIAAPQVGFIYTIAGNGVGLTAVPTGSGTAGTYNNTTYPQDGTTPAYPALAVDLTVRKLSIDSHNNIYIADSSNQVVWFLDGATGYIRVLAGSFGGAHPAVTTPAIVVQPSTPIGCSAQTNATGDGCPASLSEIYANADMGVAPDNLGNVYLTDAEGGVQANSRLRKVLSGLNFPATTVGGAATTQTIEVHFGPLDSKATTNPFTVTGTDFTLGTAACVTEADTTNDCKLPITFKPTVPGYDTATLTITSVLGGVNTYLVTGTGSTSALAIDPGTASLLTSTINNAQGTAVDGAGNVYIADTANNRVLKYTALTTTTTTFAGTGTAGYTGDGAAATAAKLTGPKGVTVDSLGNVYIADTGNNVIRKVTVGTGVISTYAGTGTAGYTGDTGLAKSATFAAPSGIVADNEGNVFVADTTNNVIRQLSNDGYVYTIAGGATSVCLITVTDSQGDGCAGLQAIFNGPTGLAFDATGTFLIVADTGDNNVRRISLGNTIVTLATTPAATIGLLNQVTLIAGNGTNGSSVSASGIATQSQLNKPTGVAIDAAENVYIADTGNAAIRLVNSGIISTIAGILTAPGTGTALPTSAINAQLTSPAAVAVSQIGTVYIVDSGNNRVLTDNRSMVSYNFGRVNVGASSPVQAFSETNLGILAATLPTAAQSTATGSTTQFTLTPPTGSGGCALGSTLAVGASCITNGQFTPTAANATPYSATYSDTVLYSTIFPSITLVGTGAILTPTTSTVAQTAPTGSAQYGQALTLTATIAATCNTAAPSCFPSGTVKIIVDGTSSAPLPLSATATASNVYSGLSVGTHSVSCSYSGDNFYAASSCTTITITVVQANTVSTLTATPNNQPQFTPVTLTANVVSSTIGVPTGSVAFYSDGMLVGTATAAVAGSGTSAVAVLVLKPSFDNFGNLTGPGSSLLPGTHTLTCTFTGTAPSNYATSNCAPITFTVLPQAPTLLLYPRPCNYNVLTVDGTVTPTTTPALQLTTKCGSTTNAATITAFSITSNVATFTAANHGLVAGQMVILSNFINGTFFNGKTVTVLAAGLTTNSFTVAFTNANVATTTDTGVATVIPVVSVADGSTTDVTVLVLASNTLSGTLSYSCSGLPATTTCTITPQGLTLTPSTGVSPLQYFDVTFWTDIKSTSSLRKPAVRPGRATGSTEATLALILGWPITFAGLFAFIRLRRKAGLARSLSLLAMLVVMIGSSLVFTGCAGPGTYSPVLTPSGSYPITITVTGGGATATTLVYFNVTSPGITGQE